MKNPLKTTSAIKHSDWPYIIQHYIYFLLLTGVAFFLFDGTAFIISSIALAAFLLLVTFFHIYRLQKMEAEIQLQKIQAIGELQTLLNITAPLPPMTGWAATPELSISILKQIMKKQPAVIAELGSGITTLVNGYAVQKYSPDGKVFSFDHDTEYARETIRELELHGLSDFVEVQTAQLKEIALNDKTYKWYDLSKFLLPGKIDLLIIDGPPLQTHKFARYPALPLLADKLSDDAVIIMHDTNRKEESQIIEMWLKQYPEFEALKLQTDKGITILKC